MMDDDERVRLCRARAGRGCDPRRVVSKQDVSFALVRSQCRGGLHDARRVDRCATDRSR